MAFKMKGHTLPGVKQLKSNDLDDGRSGSAAFQQSDPFAGSDSNKEKNGLEKQTFIDSIKPLRHEFTHQPIEINHPPSPITTSSKESSGEKGNPFNKK